MHRLFPLEYRELKKQVTKFLKDGILEVSQSPFGAPVLFVPKPNGRGLRLCVDYGALNSITVKNGCTIARIDDLLDEVAGSEYFTSLDLTSGYQQILISEKDRPKTAFRTPFAHFQFKVVGLTNAPATFQTVMNSIFYLYIRKFVVVYIDDIPIFSKSEAEHQAHVRLVFEVLKREKFYVCEVKSSFAQKDIKYLGHIVYRQGFRPNPKKVEAIQTWSVPKNVHDVYSFLGLDNYFRKFIEHYSEIAVPLTNLTRKANAWDWSGRCQDAFELLKQKLTEALLGVSGTPLSDEHKRRDFKMKLCHKCHQAKQCPLNIKKGASVAPLSDEQKKRDFELKLCHKCHQPSHQAKQCPLNKKKGRKVAVASVSSLERRVVGGGFLDALGATRHVLRESKTVLDLTE
jgi:hypothetical protein